MKNIGVYDIEYDKIDKICEDNDMMPWDVIELLMEYVEDMKRDNDLV